METTPADLDASRAAIAERGLIAAAAGHLTEDVARRLPFESLAPFKNLLKQFFSAAGWSPEDGRALSELVKPEIVEGWWEHELGTGLTIAYGIRAGEYVMYASGAAAAIAPVAPFFARAFTGPVVPEPTPHPQKIKFSFGGEPAPGVWVRRSEAGDTDDDRVNRLFEESDITDVMVAGDFVTIGLARGASWEDRVERLLDLVTTLFSGGSVGNRQIGRTREDLLQEAAHVGLGASADELHLLDVARPEHRRRLEEALEAPDARDRRIAVALLGEADDTSVRAAAIRHGFADSSRLVRRTAIDVAGDADDDGLRSFLEKATGDADSWIRWRAVRALGSLGAADSRAVLERLASDPEFRVRFEAERVLSRELS